MAVWSASIDCQAFALGVALLLTTGSSALPMAPKDPWWFDSCSLLSHTRHSRSTHSAVQHQIILVMSNLDRTIKKDVQSLFPKMQHINKNLSVNYSWLKNNQFLQQMRRDPTNALGVFHKALQKYAGTIYKLNHSIRIVSNGTRFDEERRTVTLNKISDELKRLLCEIETELDFRGLPMPDKLRLEQMKIRLPKIMDITAGSVQYFGFLKKYRNFLKKSDKVLFGRRKKDKGKVKKNKKKGAANKQIKKRES